MVIRYRDAEQNLFAKEPEIKKAIKGIERQIAMMRQRYEDKRVRMEKKRGELEERQKTVLKNLTHKRDGLICIIRLWRMNILCLTLIVLMIKP